MPRPDRSRAALIDTAALLFRRQGYAATGVNQILETADVKAGSLYHHFPNGKQELAAAVVDSAGGEIERLLRRFLESDSSVADIVAGWIDLLTVPGVRPARRLSDRADRHRVRHASPQVREAAAKVFNGWRSAVTDRLRADGWPDDQADQTALAVIALVEGALLLSRITGDAAGLSSAKTAARSLLNRARPPRECA